MPRGGKREGAGMPVRNIPIDEVHAKRLHLLVGQRRWLTGEATGNQEIAQELVERWIDEAWNDLHERLEDSAEEALAGNDHSAKKLAAYLERWNRSREPEEEESPPT